jgi:RHS repeat-associated protein
MGQQSAPYVPGAAEYWTTYSYDGLGRTAQSELADGSITNYSYSGNTVTDPAGNTKTFTIDALGNLTQVQEPDPALGTVSTNYTYDMLNHLIQVSMPRGSNTQTRTFNYITGTTVGTNLLSATNPENGTVTYTYNSDNTLHTKTDAKGQVFTYSYDSYKRLTQVEVGSTVLRTFMYDTNTLDSSFSGSYTQGRLVAVQNQAFTPQGYVPGQGGSNISVPSSMQFIEMYYTQAGLTSGKRLQLQETFKWYVNNNLETNTQTLNMDGTYTYNNEGKMTSVNYPSTYAWNGTEFVTTSGPTYTYTFDAMYRPLELKDQNNNMVVNNVSYNAANQLLTFNTETHTYNNLNQMTRLTITGSAPLDISYNFTAGANNGKIATQKDNLSGEMVTYQYDSLNRLISASSTQSWSETYGFDSFGNLLTKTPTGGAPTLSQSVNTANNQIVGQSYDANGNQLGGPLGGVSYDAENRVASAAGGVQYAYDSRNKRVWRSILSGGNLAQQVYVYGVDGQKIGTYTFTLAQYGQSNTPEMTNSTVLLAQFFGRKRVGTYDRLGSAKYNQSNNQAQSFYPYGEDRGTVEPNDELKFATYTRDAATGLDYADQRYYASNFGRMMSPDPYLSNSRGPGDPKSPRTWNRYTYGGNDPINLNDPSGLWECDPEDDDCQPCDDLTCNPYSTPTDASQQPEQVPSALTSALNALTGSNLIDGYDILNPNQFQITLTSTQYLTLSEDGFIQVSPVVIEEAGEVAITVGRLAIGLIAAWYQYFSGQKWKAGSFPTVPEVQVNCTPVGPPIVNPAINYPGGKSIEQEYLCPDGMPYTIHTITDGSGRVREIHVRPGPPKYVK